MGLSISASSIKLVVPGRTTDTSGSTSEQAYRATLKDLQQAQKKLVTDLGNRADEKVIDGDKLAVQMAQAAVAAAAAAVAREKAEAQQSRSASANAVDAPRDQKLSAAQVSALAASSAEVDLYA